MAYTQAQKDALEKAIASGVLEVSYDGKTVKYRSFSQLKKTLEEVKRGLAEQEGKTTTRHVRIYARKGL